MEKIENRRLGWKRELSCVCANRLQCEAPLLFALILAQIFLRDLLKRWKKLDAHDAPKRMIRRHQERSPFARSQIDEDEIVKVASFLMQSLEHFVEQSGIRGLIRRVENP